jgi:branched-chain amino acid transport system substrate-binding protein
MALPIRRNRAGLESALPAQAAEDIVIGEVNSYTRLPAFLEPYKKGWELAVEQINADGGIDGRSAARDQPRRHRLDPATAVQDRRGTCQPARGARHDLRHLPVQHRARGIGLCQAEAGLLPGLRAAVGRHGLVVGQQATPTASGPRPICRPRCWPTQAAKTGAKKWATIAPNYAYGKDAVKAAFRSELKKLDPEVEFVAEQWPTLFKIDAGRRSSARWNGLQARRHLQCDLWRRSGQIRPRGFAARAVRRAHGGVAAERASRNICCRWAARLPRTGSSPAIRPTPSTPPSTTRSRPPIWSAGAKPPRPAPSLATTRSSTIAAAIEKAGSTDTDAMLAKLWKGSRCPPVPTGPFMFRAADHQATMGAYVGRTTDQEGRAQDEGLGLCRRRGLSAHRGRGSSPCGQPSRSAEQATSMEE